MLNSLKGLSPPWIATGIVVLLIVSWEALAGMGAIPTDLLSRPSEVYSAAGRAWDTGRLLSDIRVTFIAVTIGLIAGTVVGEVLGMTFARFHIFRNMFEWLFYALNSMPRFALAPILLVVLGLGLPTKATVAFLASVIPVTILVSVGVQKALPGMQRICAVYGVSQLGMFWKVMIPSSIPHLASGVQLGFTRALLAVIITEMVNPISGLGRWIVTATINLDASQTMFVAVLVAMLGAPVVLLIGSARDRLAPWSNS